MEALQVLLIAHVEQIGGPAPNVKQARPGPRGGLDGRSRALAIGPCQRARGPQTVRVGAAAASLLARQTLIINGFCSDFVIAEKDCPCFSKSALSRRSIDYVVQH